MPRDRTPVLPLVVELYASPWNCGGLKGIGWEKIPVQWYSTAKLADSGIQDADSSNIAEHGSGTIAFRDTIHASYTAAATVLTGDMVTPPVNKTAIDDLTKRLAKDFWGWRLVAFDTVFNGVIAPDLDGHTDEVTWTYTTDRCETRVKTAPWDDFPESFNHSDPASDCGNCVAICGNDTGGAVLARTLCYDPFAEAFHFKAGNTLGNCCCGSKPGVCYVTITILSADGSSLPGATVTWKGITASPGQDGKVTLGPITAFPSNYTVCVGKCCFDRSIGACAPITLYYCEATCDYGGVAHVKWQAESNGGKVISMTGGANANGTGLPGGNWNSYTPGTATWCYLSTELPCTDPNIGNNLSFLGIGIMTYVPGYIRGFISTDPAYYDSCDGAIVICCGHSTYYPKFYETAKYIVAICGYAICGFAAGQIQGCVNATNAMPKTVCVTATSSAMHSYSGNKFTLHWDPTSGDGTVGSAPAIYDSGCLPASGGYGICVSSNGLFVFLGNKHYYGSAKLTLRIDCLGARVYYRNFWGAGCPNPDPHPICGPFEYLQYGNPVCPYIDPAFPRGVESYWYLPFEEYFYLYSTNSYYHFFDGCCDPLLWQSPPTLPFESCPSITGTSCYVDDCSLNGGNGIAAGMAAGFSSANGVGSANPGTASASGYGFAYADGGSTAVSTGSIVGIASSAVALTGSGATTGNATGSSSVSAQGLGAVIATGIALSASSSAAVGTGGYISVGSADSLSNTTATSITGNGSFGTALGNSTVSATSLASSVVTGLASGSCFAIAAGSCLAVSVGLAVESSTAFAQLGTLVPTGGGA